MGNIPASAGTTTAQDTAGIIAAAVIIAMQTEATEMATVGATIATEIVGVIVTTGVDTEVEDIVAAT
jgi:hypothetical protein